MLSLAAAVFARLVLLLLLAGLEGVGEL